MFPYPPPKGGNRNTMAEETWREDNDDRDPLPLLLGDWGDPATMPEPLMDFFQDAQQRRMKAALVQLGVWGLVIGLHYVSWGAWAVALFGGLLSVQALRLVTARSAAVPSPLHGGETGPTYTLLVAAKNEEAVIARLAENLCTLDYPTDRYEVWFVDDNSDDRTGEILDTLTARYGHLHVIHRGGAAGGGKSGALNEAFQQTRGEIVAVFDADAQVPTDLLRQVSPLFQSQENLGAVQVRKAIANAPLNFWTRGQNSEMMLDAYFQQQRIALGGIGELRGNGQFVRRTAIARSGGWNEATITDDLDLTMRLHLDQWEIGFLLAPAVQEEGVTDLKSLWHQRSRWAEGGFQRYLDYWRLMLSQPMILGKRIDLYSFILMQYLLPGAALPDAIMCLLRQELPVLGPLTVLMLTLSAWSMTQGIRRSQGPTPFPKLLGQVLTGMVYMLHWLVVMPVITLKMAIFPKRLKWVKTVHHGV